MEEVTTVYEQLTPEVEVIDLPGANPSPSSFQATPEKAYEWMTNMQGPNGLVESVEYSNFVSLYDNSLAALAFIAEGDLERAEQIFDFFNSRLDSEFRANYGGFFQYRERSGENGSRIWMGDNAWLLLALNHYHETTQTDRYSILAAELDQYLRSLQEEDGGLKGGINEDGSDIARVTEGIITAFNAVKGYDEFHEGILMFLREQRWDPEENVLITDSENTSYQHALDLYSLGYLILEDYPEAVLFNAERFFNTQTATVHKKTISGYCFDDDRDVVWLEGTAQMALAFQAGGQSEQTLNIILNIEETFIGSAVDNGVMGLPYTTNQGTNFGALPLWNHASTSPAISSTAWYLMVKKGVNPFLSEKAKNIPQSLRFWQNGQSS
jgi:hypothetical protein